MSQKTELLLTYAFLAPKSGVAIKHFCPFMPENPFGRPTMVAQKDGFSLQVAHRSITCNFRAALLCYFTFIEKKANGEREIKGGIIVLILDGNIEMCELVICIEFVQIGNIFFNIPLQTCATR